MYRQWRQREFNVGGRSAEVWGGLFLSPPGGVWKGAIFFVFVTLKWYAGAYSEVLNLKFFFIQKL